MPTHPTNSSYHPPCHRVFLGPLWDLRGGRLSESPTGLWGAGTRQWTQDWKAEQTLPGAGSYQVPPAHLVNQGAGMCECVSTGAKTHGGWRDPALHPT